MSVRLVLLLGAVLCLHTFCSFTDTKDQKKIFPGDFATVAFRSNEFSIRIFKILATQNPGSNIIISPISISMALAFLALGARSNSKTEILQSLKFNLTTISEDKILQVFQLMGNILRMPKNNLKEDLSTALFVDQQLALNNDFQQKAQELYGANITFAQFEDFLSTVKLINHYVKQKTHGKIENMVKGLDIDTKMVLVNYLLFKAKWKMPFNPGYTFNSTFYLSTKKWVNITSMRFENTNLLYYWDNKYSLHVVLLPYMSDRASMLLLLPNNGAMPKVEAELNMDLIYYWRNTVNFRTVHLYLPKFSISGHYNLEEILPTLGIKKIFWQVEDFSDLTTNKMQVVHKAILNVAEEGTEELTYRGGSKILPPNRSRSLDFCRTFMVVVFSEDTQNILLLAKVENPNQA
ncbi:serine protease inhibitor 2.1-like [Sorex fumeus]|uniref:serine protease inhibitor 2.1-like n=1 Tax=Sorex fumeus TaxID=62283 RepID=UPI0024ACF08F|nr:serine protease inhibitor 2.1-like [Sorex fumeus]